MAELRVRREMCATCIFRPDNPMMLRRGRVKMMLEDCARGDTHIACHETIEAWTGDPETWAVCRGYLETGQNDGGRSVRLALSLDLIREV